jgi:RNA polymerase sigma-70 factor (ECF subfamily)
MPLTTTRIRVPGQSQVASIDSASPHQEDSYRELSALELVQSCLHSGADASWTEFVRRFQPLIAGTIIKAVRRWTMPNPTLVEDLVQDTYVKLCADDFKPLRQFNFRHENALIGFLRVVAENVVQDHFRGSWCRKRGNGKVNEVFDQSFLSDGESFARKVEREILLEQIYRCLERQPFNGDSGRNTTIFWLYYCQGLTADAISELKGLSLSTKGVESTLLRLNRLIKENLGIFKCAH